MHLRKHHAADMERQQALHVVLGAGQIGHRLAQMLVASGHRVRQVRQSAQLSTIAGVELVAGDITDPAFAERVGAGASVVYDCMNPPYHRWPELLLALGRGSLRAAETSGARLVALDCLYMYGRPQGPMGEDHPLAPCSKKGELRVQLAELRLAATGRVPVAIGRASDFFGTGLPSSLFSDRLFERILAGKRAEVFGNPDMPHAFTYADDVARGLATLGSHDAAPGHVWHLPTNPAITPRALMRELGRALDRDVEVMAVPRWLLRGMGLFSPLMREMVEMLYQFEAPFELDSARFTSTFGWRATPMPTAIAQTAAWARDRYGFTKAA